MVRIAVTVLLSAGLWLQAAPSAAQRLGLGLIPTAEARRHGLERAWFVRVDLDPSRDRIQSLLLYQPRPAVLPEAADPAVAQDTVQPAGPAAPSAAPASVPAATEPPVLYVQTRRGLIHAIHAETGGTLWIAQVGNPLRPSDAPAVNSRFLAVVNTTRLYLLDRYTGHLIWEKEVDVSPITGIAMSEEWVYVPGANGRLRAYHVEDPEQTWFYSSTGRIEAPPIVTASAVAWSSSAGHMYISRRDKGEVTKRFDTRKPVSAPLTYAEPYLYLASRDGFVYCIHERTGDNPWRFSVGEELSQPPVVVRGYVYPVAEVGGMHRVSAATGESRWWAPRVARFLAASADRVYVADQLGRLLILDAQTGVRLDEMRIDRLDLLFTNQENDRIYLGTSTGIVQCLREMGQIQPLVHEHKVGVPPTALPDATAQMP
jgi:outer membrane protein assembly factor BamB